MAITKYRARRDRRKIQTSGPGSRVASTCGVRYTTRVTAESVVLGICQVDTSAEQGWTELPPVNTGNLMTGKLLFIQNSGNRVISEQIVWYAGLYEMSVSFPGADNTGGNICIPGLLPEMKLVNGSDLGDTIIYVTEVIE